MLLQTIFNSNSSLRDKFITLISYLGAIVLAIGMHEFAHGFIAYKNGDLTAKMSGRLTINPIKHFDPIGFIMLVFFGFGWAKPVPINPNNFNKIKKGMISTSVAGVITNLIMAIISAILLWAFNFIPAVNNTFLEIFLVLLKYFFVYSMLINLSLMAFNLLPIFPLDGFRLIETLTKPNNKFVEFMRRYGGLVLLGLILAGNILSTISPLFNILGLYLGSIQKGFIWFFELIFRTSLF